MKCVLLCAGRGERMMPLTANTPKPLLKVGSKALIDYVLESLPDEIDEIIIVVKYLGNQIKKHIGQEYKGKRVRYVAGSDKGNTFSFLNTRKYLKDERFLLIYGDEIPNPLNVRNCLKHELSFLTFMSNGKWLKNGIMVLNTNIFNYFLVHRRINPVFKEVVHWFFIGHQGVEVKDKYFVGGINTPLDIKRVEGILNG